MSKLSYAEVGDLLGRHGFGATERAIGAAVVMAESGGDTHAVHTNTDGSVDRGLWQINSTHVQSGQISEAACFDPDASTDYAYQLSHGGHDFSAWSAYNNGSWKKWAPAMAPGQLGPDPGMGPGAAAGAAVTGPIAAAINAIFGPVFKAVGDFVVNAGLVVLGGLAILGGLYLAAVVAREQAPQGLKRAAGYLGAQRLLKAV